MIHFDDGSGSPGVDIVGFHGKPGFSGNVSSDDRPDDPPIGTLIHAVVFPLLFFSAILGIVSCLSDKYKVNQLAGLLRKVSVGILGSLLTVFLGIISVQGATAAVADGVTVRTAKYVTGNFVPVVGPFVFRCCRYRGGSFSVGEKCDRFGRV